MRDGRFCNVGWLVWNIFFPDYGFRCQRAGCFVVFFFPEIQTTQHNNTWNMIEECVSDVCSMLGWVRTRTLNVCSKINATCRHAFKHIWYHTSHTHIQPRLVVIEKQPSKECGKKCINDTLFLCPSYLPYLQLWFWCMFFVLHTRPGNACVPFKYTHNTYTTLCAITNQHTINLASPESSSLSFPRDILVERKLAPTNSNPIRL